MMSTGFTCSSTCMMAVSSVSASTSMRCEETRSLSARIRSWPGDSSPEMYRLLPGLAMRAASWSISVDLPMPGSPPTSTEEPRMSPPPSTRFISAIPVSSRIPSRVSMEASGMGSAVFFDAARAGRARLRRGRPGSAAATSVNPFHVPHSGHRPSQRGSWWPQPEHSNTVF